MGPPRRLPGLGVPALQVRPVPAGRVVTAWIRAWAPGWAMPWAVGGKGPRSCCSRLRRARRAGAWVAGWRAEGWRRAQPWHRAPSPSWVGSLWLCGFPCCHAPTASNPCHRPRPARLRDRSAGPRRAATATTWRTTRLRGARAPAPRRPWPRGGAGGAPTEHDPLRDASASGTREAPPRGQRLVNKRSAGDRMAGVRGA